MTQEPWVWNIARERLAHLIQTGKVERRHNGDWIRWTREPLSITRHTSSRVSRILLAEFEDAGLALRAMDGRWGWTDAGIVAYADLASERAAAA